VDAADFVMVQLFAVAAWLIGAATIGKKWRARDQDRLRLEERLAALELELAARGRQADAVNGWLTEQGLSLVCWRCGVHRSWTTGCPKHPREVLGLTNAPVRVDESPFRRPPGFGPREMPIGPRESAEMTFRRREDGNHKPCPGYTRESWQPEEPLVCAVCGKGYDEHMGGGKAKA
jgi:hypothetical protein